MATVLKTSQCLIANAARAANHKSWTLGSTGLPSKQLSASIAGRPFQATSLNRAAGKAARMPVLAEEICTCEGTNASIHCELRVLDAGRKFLMSSAVLASSATAESAFDFQVTDIDGKKVDLSKYKGNVVLVVNVASQCGELLPAGVCQLLAILKCPGEGTPSKWQAHIFCFTGFTPQYKELGELYRGYSGQGLVILGECLCSQNMKP